ncbi:hypothetical protein BDV19DRAFT_355583 [Aspergillus venezuelensis]
MQGIMKPFSKHPCKADVTPRAALGSIISLSSGQSCWDDYVQQQRHHHQRSLCQWRCDRDLDGPLRINWVQQLRRNGRRSTPAVHKNSPRQSSL